MGFDDKSEPKIMSAATVKLQRSLFKEGNRCVMCFVRRKSC